MDYKYRAQISRKSRPGPKWKYFPDREAMIQRLAELRTVPLVVYSAAAHGLLKNGDTLDAIRREIKLTIRILELELKLSKHDHTKKE